MTLKIGNDFVFFWKKKNNVQVKLCILKVFSFILHIRGFA